MLNIRPGWPLSASAATPGTLLVETQSPPTGHLRASHREAHSVQRSSGARWEPRSQSPDPRRPVRELDLRRKALVPYRALSRGPSSRLNISASTPRSARVRTRATPPLTARKPLTPLGESPSPRRTNPPHTHAAKALTLGGAKPRRRLVWTARSVWPPARPHPWPHTGIDQGADFAEVVLRGGLDLSGAREHQRQLPAQSCGARLPRRADGPARSGLVGLRELPADAHRPVGADGRGEVVHRVSHAMRALEADHRPLLGLELLAQGPAPPRFARQEPFEAAPV